MLARFTALLLPALLMASPAFAQNPFGKTKCLPPMRVETMCQVSAAYRYEDCRVVDGPDAEALGPAALQRIQGSEAPRVQPNGASSVGASYRIPMTFERRGGVRDFGQISPDFVSESLYPADALKRHVSGRVVIECSVAEDRRLAGCRVISETPRGKRFAQAGLALAGTVLACDRIEGPKRMIANFRNRPGETAIVTLIGASEATETDD